MCNIPLITRKHYKSHVKVGIKKTIKKLHLQNKIDNNNKKTSIKKKRRGKMLEEDIQYSLKNLVSTDSYFSMFTTDQTLEL